jgi:hypothetical protein
MRYARAAASHKLARTTVAPSSSAVFPAARRLRTDVTGQEIARQLFVSFSPG